jgi:hypothetical protein
MARLFFCVVCRAELEQVRIAGGSTVVVCITCDTIGNAHEVVHGARLIPVDSRRKRAA